MPESHRPVHSLCVVAPFYNEAIGASTFYTELTTVLESLGVPYRCIFVDDGSKDDTLQVLSRIAREDTRIGVLALGRNFGHQAALTAGLDYADGDVVIVMDSDLQHPPHIIKTLLEHYAQGADVVYAIRENVQAVSWGKRLFSQGYYRLMQRATNVTIIPNAPDFRLMSYEVVLALRQMRESHRYLRGMVAWLGFETAFVPYQQPPRFAGKPSFTWRQSLRMAYHGLFSFSTLPLRLITYLGLSLTALAFVYLVYTLYIYFVERTPIQGWTSLIVVVLLVGGVQLISIGVIAQYIGMIFEQVKQRPLYTLKRTINIAQSTPRPLKDAHDG